MSVLVASVLWGLCCLMFRVASLKEVKGVSAVSFVGAERLELALREEFCPLQVFCLHTR